MHVQEKRMTVAGVECAKMRSCIVGFETMHLRNTSFNSMGKEVSAVYMMCSAAKGVHNSYKCYRSADEMERRFLRIVSRALSRTSTKRSQPCSLDRYQEKGGSVQRSGDATAHLMEILSATSSALVTWAADKQRKTRVAQTAATQKYLLQRVEKARVNKHSFLISDILI